MCEVDLNLLKALNICCAAEAIKEHVKLPQAGSVLVLSAAAVHVVNLLFTTSLQLVYNKFTLQALQSETRMLVVIVVESYIRLKAAQLMARCVMLVVSRSESRSVSSLTDGMEEVFVCVLFINIDTVSKEKTSWYKTLSINNTELNCKLDTGA